METVGGYLKKARESKNISIGELSQLTKISELYLKYIENDEFEKLPQGPYVKGYIASYSRLIEGNVDEAISLYEALNRKQIQTEDIQPDTSAHNGRNRLPEKPEVKESKQPQVSLVGKVKLFFSTMASSVPINSDSFKAAGTSIKNIGASIRTNGDVLDIVVSFFKRIAVSWSWLYASMALLGIAILVLAGFGFYHLFIYDPNSLSIAQLQHVQDKDARPLLAIDSEKSVLASESTDASPTADKLVGHTNDIQSSEATNPPEGKKQATPSSTDSDEVTIRTKLEPENSSGTSNPVIQTNPPLSGSSSSAKNADSNRTIAGTERQVRSGQSELNADPLPEPTTTDAALNVLQASVCAEIKNRMPSGVDTSFLTTAQRVYVWSEIEAQQVPSKIRHIYYFNGQKIGDVHLDVRSTNWRTWSFKNISDSRYRGDWWVDIATPDGKVLRRLYFVVR